MSVATVIKELELIPNREKVKVYVLVRPREDHPTREEREIVGMEFNEDDRCVSLLINAPTVQDVLKPIVTVESLLNALEELPKEYENYSVMSGEYFEIDENHSGREDWPFDGIANNDDMTVMVFVQRLDE